MKNLFKVTAMLAGLASIIIFAGCLNEPETPSIPKIRINIETGENFEEIQKEERIIEVEKDSLWKDIQKQAEEKVKPIENYEIENWKLDSDLGEEITDETKFTEDTTVFVSSRRAKSGEITITIKSDKGIAVKQSYLKKPSGIQWKTLKYSAGDAIHINAEYDLTGWKIGGKHGADINDETKFDSDITIYASALEKGAVPTLEKIKITITSDDGLTVTNPSLSVDKNSKWEHIKIGAENAISTKKGYEIAYWKQSGASGPYIEDSTVFLADTTIYAASKPASDSEEVSITITIMGDEGIRVDTKSFEANKKDLWKKLAPSAERAVSLKKGYKFKGWKLKNANGAAINDNTKFEKNETVFAVSEKQNTNIHIEKIDIKIAGDEGITVNTTYITEEKETIKIVGGKAIAKNTVWKDIERKAKDCISVHPYYDLIGWKIDSEKGAVLSPETEFTKNETIYAVTKKKDITVTITAGEGITVTKSYLKFSMGTAWKNIKSKAEESISVNPQYDLTSWKLNNKNGSYINLETEFKTNTTVFAASKKKGDIASGEKITITVTAGDGITVREQNKFKADKGSLWQNIKNGAHGLINLDSKYNFAEWKISNAFGEKIDDNKAFTKDTIIYAAAEKKTLDIRVTGDSSKGVRVKKPILKIEIDSLWKDIKNKAKEAILVNSDYSIKDWHFNDENGALLTDDTIFTEAKTIFAETIEKGADASTKVEITLTANEGTTFKTNANPVKVNKNSSWKNIKKKIKDSIELNDNYEILNWKLNDDNGNEIEENTKFEENKTIYIKTRKVITITIKGDERVEESQFKAAPNQKWSDIKINVEKALKLKAGWGKASYNVYQWYYDSENGSLIGDDDRFNASKIIYAITNYSKFKEEGSNLKGFTSAPPRGRIYIKDGITKIDNNALKSCGGITQIVIPNSVTEIGSAAFKGCSKIKTISMPNVRTIPKSAFEKCENLERIDMGNATKIEKSAFEGCAKLAGITIPNVGTIEAAAFKDCEKLSSISFGTSSSITTITQDTFKNCKNLTSINLPQSITKIEQSAFEGCTKLGSITIPDSVQTIEKEAFINCENLETLTIGRGVNLFVPSVFEGCKKLKTVTIRCPKIPENFLKNSAELQSLTLEDGASEISQSAFEGCEKLSSLTITANISKIEQAAFKNCKKIATVTLPNSVTNIEQSAFEGCEEIANLNLPNGLEHIKQAAFKGCKKIGQIIIPDSVKTIEQSAFEGCEEVSTLTFGSTASTPDTPVIETIKQGAFKGCKKITTVTLPNRLKNIEESAFEGCEKLENLTIGRDLESAGINAFKGCIIKNLAIKCEKIPDALLADTPTLETVNLYSVKEIGNGSFKGCINLNTINLSGITKIGSFAFSKCEKLVLTNNAIPSSVESIGIEAFKECKSLESISINSALTEIPASAFEGCEKFNITGTLPSGLKKIGDSAFKGCKKYNNTSLPATLEEIGSNAFEGCEEFNITGTLPSNLKTIGSAAFKGCKMFNGEISNSVESIGREAFEDCISLTKINIPSRVKNIADSAFKGCIGVTGDSNITISNSVINIGNSAFENCTGITKITVPNEVISIGSQAFKGCTRLSEIVLGDKVKEIGNEALLGCPLTTISLNCIKVPNNLLTGTTSLTTLTFGNKVEQIGKEAFKGCTRITSIDIKDSITSIAADAFSGCTALSTVTLGKELRTIGSEAFKDCPITTLTANCIDIPNNTLNKSTNLTSLTLGNQVKTIGAEAFKECNSSSFTTLNIPDSVTSIAAEAFRGCTNLSTVTLGEGLTSVGTDAFKDCNINTLTVNCKNVPDNTLKNSTSLNNLTFGSQVEKIGAFAFNGCTAITQVIIPASVTSIAIEAFRGCTNLSNVTLGEGLTSVGTDAFKDCSNNAFKLIVKCKNVPSNTINSDKLKTLVIENSVETIKADAFKDCTAITALTIPASVTEIGARAFSGCTGILSSYTIKLEGNGITAIGTDAFKNVQAQFKVKTADIKTLLQNSGVTPSQITVVP